MPSSIYLLPFQRLGDVLLYLFVFLSFADFTYSQLQQGLDPGGQSFLGTPVVAPPTLPTMYYNCALMPAICNNVQQWLNDNSQTLPREFHVQTNNQLNTDRRRQRSCPGTWDTTHVCPEPIGQPATIHAYGRINGNTANIMIQFGNSLLINNLVSVPPVFSPFTNEIQGSGLGESSGLAYTCDEFPPASWIEGGSGELSHANTFCAPQGVSCSGMAWKTVKNTYHGVQNNPYPLTRSEQNWQAAAHSLLSRYFTGLAPKKVGKVGKFVFATTNILPGATPNAAIIRFPLSTKTITKRGLEHEETGFPDIPALEQKLAQHNGSRTLNHRGVEVTFVPAERTPAPLLHVNLGEVKADNWATGS